MKVYVIRHGESENNQRKYWSGWYDTPLTDKGRADAEKAGAFLRGIVFDKIYTSDLSRAIETAETALPGCVYETTPLAREINVGRLADTPYALSTEARARLTKEGYAAFDGETKEEFNDRVCRFMKQLETLDCERVAVFSHAGWMRRMLDQVIGIPLPGQHICCNNCTIAVFEYTDDIWKLHSWINLS